MGQSGGTNENEGAAVPSVDKAWNEVAERSASENRRYQAPPPRHDPAQWRAWTPPEQADRYSLPPGRRGLRLTRVFFVLLGLIVLGSLISRLPPASDGANNRMNPAVSVPMVPLPPNGGTMAAVPAAPLTTLAAPAARPTMPVVRPLPWTPATVMPLTGLDATRADVFATIKVGTCLATTSDLRSTVVPCSGPHTDEVTLLRDLTAMFATTPTNDRIQTLNDQLCPAAAQAWTGGADQRYTPGYLWQFEDGTPGQVVRAFACTAMLSGHSPFSGTLWRAAA